MHASIRRRECCSSVSYTHLIAREPFDTAPFLQGIEAVCAPQARERGQRFSISAAGLAPAYLGDALRLNQILINLLSNALKYTPEAVSYTHL